MLITKTVGCILIILSSTLMGFYYSNELKSRVNNLKELRKLIVLLRGISGMAIHASGGNLCNCKKT